MPGEISINLTDFNDISIYAFRYALGRKTYAVPTMASFLLKNKDNLSAQSKEVIVRDIKVAFKTNNYGMECDKIEWQKVLDKFEIKVVSEPLPEDSWPSFTQ